MISAQSLRDRAERCSPPSRLAPTFPYVRVPLRLAQDALHRPHLVGIYALIARLWRLSSTPVALSVDDLCHYDPALVPSTTQRALAWLADAGWLIATRRRGHKTTYTPTWGLVRGAVVAWEAGMPSLGRPGHVRSLALDTRLLDYYMGRLVPHRGQQPGNVSRYLSAPALALTDIGSYVQMQAGLVIAPSVALVRCGLVRDGVALPLPASEATLLAALTQRTLFDPTAPLVLPAGLRRAGLSGAAGDAATTSATLFFVEPTITEGITRHLTRTITTNAPCEETASVASECGMARGDDAPKKNAWNRGSKREQINPPQGGTPSFHNVSSRTANSQHKHISHLPTGVQDQRSDLLRGAGVAAGSIIHYVNKKNIDLAIVQQAVAACRAEDKGPGYVTWMLREYCATGALPRITGTVPDAPIDWAAERQKHAGLIASDVIALAAPQPVRTPAAPAPAPEPAVVPDAAASVPENSFTPPPPRLATATVLAALLIGQSQAVQRALRAARLTLSDGVLTIQPLAGEYATLLPECRCLTAAVRHLGLTRVEVRR